MKPKPKKPSPVQSDVRNKPIPKAAITTIGGLAALFAGLYLAYGLAAVLIAGGIVAVVFGLVWESE